MSYKFQLGPARLSGSLVQEGDVDLAGGMKISGSLVLGSDRAMQNLASVSASAGISGFTGTFEGGLTVGDSQVIDEDRQLKNIASLDATSEATIEAAIDTLANLSSIGASSAELEALGSLDVAEGLKIANTQVFSAARALSNVTSIDASGDLTVGSITNAEFTVDASGNTDIDGTLNVEGVPTFQAQSVHSAGGTFNSAGLAACGAIAGATSIDGSGDLTMGTITMTGFTVDADGDTVVKTVSGSGAVSGLSLVIGGAGNRGIDEDSVASLNALNVNSGGITNAGAFSGATTMSGSGALQAFTGEFEGGLTVGDSQVIDEDRGLKNIASLDATTEATIEAAIDTLANLASMGGSGNELEALGSLDVAEGLKIANTSVISAARAVSNVTSVAMGGALSGVTTLAASGLASLDGGINVNDDFTVNADGAVVAVGINAGGAVSGVTSLDGSGDLTMGSITMAEFSVDSSGNTDIDGTLNVEGVPTFQAAAVFSSGISNAGAIAAATTISGSGRAQAFDVVAEGGFLVGGNKVIDEDRKLTVLSSSVSTFYGSGNAQFASGLRVEGAALFDGAVTIGNAAGDDLTLLGRMASAILPKADSTHNLGSDSLRWDTIYVDNIVGANIVKDVEARAGGQTISAGTEFALITAGDGVTVTLPAASAGKCLHVKLSSSIGDVILAAAAGDLVEAQASIRLESTGSAVNLVAYDAMTWFIV